MSNTPRSFKRKNRTSKLSFPLDPDAVEEIGPAQRDLTAAQNAEEVAAKLLAEAKTEKDRKPLREAHERASAEAAAARERYEAALADKDVVTFTFRALSGSQLQALQSDHPPTEEQTESAKKTDGPDARLDYNPDTYPPALMATACVGVEWSDGGTATKLTVAQATDFWETSSLGDQQTLMAGIGLLNQVPSRVEALGKG